MNRAASLALLAALTTTALGRDIPLDPAVAKHLGKPAPKFAFATTTGAKLTNASLKGKVVLLDFWATYCGPCKLASPKMQKLHETFGSQGLVVVGADAFEDGPGDYATPYKARHKYTFAFANKTDALAKALGASSLPAFVLIDRKGVVRRAWSGLPKGSADALYAEIAAAVTPLLKG